MKAVNMKTGLFLPVLAFACFLSVVKSECDLNGRAKEEKDFPDLMDNAQESYILGVEISDRLNNKIDYYVEYYDALNKRGRLDVHAGGKNLKYLYESETWEQWLITDYDCTFLLINESILHSDERNVHYDKGSAVPTTIGPSATLKKGLDAWNNRKKGDNTIAYMGEAKGLVRGEKAEFWRHCTGGDNFTDYFFAVPYQENPSDNYDSTVTPLRAVFSYIEDYEYYDFMSFRPVIPVGVDPFQLPIGMNCRRSHLVRGSPLPDFSKYNLYLSSEVLYERFTDDRNVPMASYYSTLTFALDRRLSHLLYVTAPWNSTKPGKGEKDQDPKQDAAEYIVYDSKGGYFYNISEETGTCDMGRLEHFYPQYKFPEGTGGIYLTDPYVFLPHNELKFLTEGKIRGLEVNIFELEVTGLLLTDDVVEKAVVTHAYLKPNEEEENKVSVKEAPVQMQLRLYRNETMLEVLTFNVFGFTTGMPIQFLFDITSCYKNDDDYSYLTIGFEIEEKYSDEIRKKRFQIEEDVVSKLTGDSFNDLRLPDVQTDMKQDYLYISLMVLERPPFELEFTNIETNKTIEVSSDDDKLGVSSFRTCAQNCLEERDGCWGFSMCGDTCYFGSSQNTKKVVRKDCTLYTKYTHSNTSVLSKDKILNDILRKVNEGEISTSVALESGDIELVATFAQITDPAEDDELFKKMGNYLDSRMKVLKVGFKLKQGTTVKNLGNLRYDECQSLCADYKDCETLSYCLSSSECMVSTAYASDLKADDKEDNQLCNLLAKKYSAHFDRTPGLTIKGEGGTSLDITDMEECARACLKESKFDCMSFDHCSSVDKQACTLYKVHYLNPKDRKENGQKNARCGHYSRKLSADFKKKEETRILGSKIAPLLNLTLEECAKTCIEYGSGTCYGYDFCQGQSLIATSCTLFDTDPSRLKSTFSDTCTHYSRTAEEFAPRPYTNSYAGGIGFLCFLVGAIISGGILLFLYKRRSRQ